MHDVLIVGAGLAGLTCARALQARGAECLVLEAADAVGGRVRTDEVDGFRLDRGFQVLLTAYPAARRWLDYEKLRLGCFAPGARVATPDGEGRVGDPLREPGKLWASLRAPVGGLADKVRIGALRLAATRGPAEAVWERGRGRTCAQELAALGFSLEMTERFLRPWLGGIFLERELRTPAPMLYFVYRMFAEGHAALPAGGMQRLPEQLAAGLRPGSLRLGARVARVAPGEVELETGETLRAREVVVAVDAERAAAWGVIPAVPAPSWRAVTTVQWDAPASPLGGEPVLWLNGTGHGRINEVVVPSDVAEGYAPAGRALVTVSVPGDAPESDEALVAALRGELRQHFGEAAGSWRVLAVQRVRRALPVLADPWEPRVAEPRRPGLWVCGDHCASASIQGAMASGEAVAAGLGGA